MAATAERLFGRARELAVLRSGLEHARGGTGGLLLVAGPPGIGKTRLVEELARDLGAGEADGCTVCWGAALDDDGMPVLWPWTRAVAAMPDVRAALAADITPETAGPADAAAATFAADTAVLDALVARAHAAPPLLLVLEDLHWADAATVRLLERLVATVRRAPVLAVATHRPVDSGPLAQGPFAQALPRLLAGSATVPVTLGPLRPDAAAALLDHAVEHADPAAVREAIDRAGGSPLVLRALTRIAAEQLRGRATWDAPLGEAAELRGLVSAALRAAGPATADAVAALSVLGRSADLDVLAGLLGARTAAAAVELVAPAAALGLVDEADGAVAFSHSLIRDAVNATLSSQRRLALHRTVAELLEPRAVGRDDRAGTVARHWVRAGEPARAVPWAVRAADDARSAGGYAEAEDYLQLALDALSPDAGADEAELLLDLARAQAIAGRVDESVRTCQRAAAVGEHAGRPDVVARAAVTVQGFGHPGVNRAVEQLCRRALAGKLDGGLSARVSAALACALTEVGDLDEAREHAQRAMAAAVAAGDRHAELDAILAGAMVAQNPWRGIDRVALGRRSVELAAQAGRPLAALWGHLWISDAAVQSGDLAAAERHIAAIGGVAEQTGLPVARWHHLRRRASLAAMAGRFELSRRLSAEASSVAVGWSDVSADGARVGYTVFLALLRGDPSDMDPDWRDHLDDSGRNPPVARAGMAAALLLDGDPDYARALYAPLIEELGRVRDARTLACVGYLCEVAVGLSDVAGSRVLRTVLADDFADVVAFGTGTIFYLGALARARAELALVCGDTETAAAEFAEAERVNTALGARPYLAHTRGGLARLALATGDFAAAVHHAKAAAAAARTLDLPGLSREASSLLDRIVADAAAADPFTRREREIAELVGRARTNRDIAAELVLSERTVESHVRNILAKTGTASRKEFIRWMLTGGRAL
ncbi:ATP-binding protein [Pseudonocardia sp. GCM10023141]|uniref:ATP-binding protein n=1 Tax=Pseudonocardia sp. GCM10023141 TaxID=3252653 RepID=UPI00361190F8